MAQVFSPDNAEYKDIGYWPSASTVYSSMANFDLFTKTTTYKAQVTDSLNKVFSLHQNYDQVYPVVP
jgi:hypothetical protein